MKPILVIFIIVVFIATMYVAIRESNKLDDNSIPTSGALYNRQYVHIDQKQMDALIEAIRELKGSEAGK